jgi:hypothetical protein
MSRIVSKCGVSAGLPPSGTQKAENYAEKTENDRNSILKKQKKSRKRLFNSKSLLELFLDVIMRNFTSDYNLLKQFKHDK